METNNLNQFFFVTFDPNDKDAEIENCLGFYSFRVLAQPYGEPLSWLVYGMHVQDLHNRVVLTYAGGDPPSVRAGLALDLHQAAAARVRADARRIRKPVAFYIDDAGQVAAVAVDRFWNERAAAVMAPPIATGQADLAHKLATSQDAVLSMSAPAPAP